MSKINYNTVLESTSKRSKIAIRIATIAVALSVAVVTVALCVADGFRVHIERKVVDLLDYIHITELPSIFISSDELYFDSVQIADIEKLITPQKLAATTEAFVVLQNDRNILSSNVVGTRGSSISSGSITLSNTAALELDVSVGDALEVLYFVDGSASIKSLRVDSIYSSMLTDIERQRAFVSAQDASLFSGRDPDVVNYYAINESFDSAPLEQYIDDEGLVLESVEERAPHLFGWLDMIDQNLSLVVLIMSVVALVNVIASALIVILDSTPKIALLRALGMSRAVIERLYFIKLGRGALFGLFFGLAFGLGICGLQYFFTIITLDPYLYFVDSFPIGFNWLKIISFNALIVVVIMLSLLLPIRVISRLSIAKAIKYE